MTYMLVRHKVADFANWKRVFDSHATAQEESGLRVEKVLRNVEDPNEVFLLFEVTDVAKARGFVSSPQVPEAMRQSGVIDNPDIYFLREPFRAPIRVKGRKVAVDWHAKGQYSRSCRRCSFHKSFSIASTQRKEEIDNGSQTNS